MNRNSTAILATTIFFSMLASSGVRSTASPRDGSSAASTQPVTFTSSKPTQTDDDLGIRITQESNKKGDYA